MCTFCFSSKYGTEVYVLKLPVEQVLVQIQSPENKGRCSFSMMVLQLGTTELFTGKHSKVVF